MTVGRRELIKGGAVAALAACGPKVTAPAAFDPADRDSGRAHFAAFVFASHPTPVRKRIAAHAAGPDRDPVGYLGRQEEEPGRRPSRCFTW